MLKFILENVGREGAALAAADAAGYRDFNGMRGDTPTAFDPSKPRLLHWTIGTIFNHVMDEEFGNA